jgi:putative tryptophan/tyrosine transport system substrate-binding protein
MRRRDFVTGLGLMSWSLTAQSKSRAQGRLMNARIGLLLGFPRSDPLTPENLRAFRDGLKSVGLEEGSNVQIVDRWPGIDPELTTDCAKELIAIRPNVIVASTNQVVSILMKETQSVPIVFVYVGDPVGSRYAETLSKPGKNLTGFANFEAPIGGKWLELLKEIAPRTKRVGFVYHPAASPHREFLEVMRATAPSLAMDIIAIAVTSPPEIDGKISEFGRTGTDGGIVVAPHALTLGASDMIVELASRHQLPGVYGDRIYAPKGGLLSFGINPPDQLRRAANYVRRIIDGEQPGNLPIQLPVKYEMIINNRTAKAFGLTTPASLLALADEVIE